MTDRLATPEGKAVHSAQMNRQTVHIPTAFFVTFSIEIGQPPGTCRHMSMAIAGTGRMPSPVAVWMIAKELGFDGEDLLSSGTLWLEELPDGGTAVNFVQPVTLVQEGHA